MTRETHSYGYPRMYNSNLLSIGLLIQRNVITTVRAHYYVSVQKCLYACFDFAPAKYIRHRNNLLAQNTELILRHKEYFAQRM